MISQDLENVLDSICNRFRDTKDCDYKCWKKVEKRLKNLYNKYA